MSDDTTKLSTEPETPAPARRRRPRWQRLLLTVGIPVVAVVVLLVVVDSVARAYAEQRVSAEIEKNRPAGVSGQVSTHIGGFSVLQQYLSGSFERVELDAPRLV